MFERCLNEAERILAADRDVIVPVKKVWQQVEKQGRAQGFETPSLVDFTALLEGDPRFEFMPSRSTDGELIEEHDLDDPEEEAELESLGFYAGDRVKLRNVELTPELIGDLIRRKVDRTMDALTKAWEMRPEGDQEAEDQLLEILAKTQKLQREVKKTFSVERMKQLGDALKGSRKPVKKGSPPKKKASTVKSRTTAGKRKVARSIRSPRARRGRRRL